MMCDEEICLSEFVICHLSYVIRNSSLVISNWTPMPPPNHLSLMMQRIGKQFIAARQKASVVIAPEESEYLKQVFHRYHLDEDSLALLCVFYTYITCGHELGLPTKPMPAYVYLRSTFGLHAYEKSAAATGIYRRCCADDVGYGRNLETEPRSARDRHRFFMVLGPNADFMQYVRDIDQGMPVEPRSSESLQIRYADERSEKEAAQKNILTTDADIDPEDCPVYIVSDGRDDFQKLEYEQMLPIMNAMSLNELEEVIQAIDGLLFESLATKTGRMYVREHPLLRFAMCDGGILTSRLDEIRQIVMWIIRQREIGAEYYAEPLQYRESEPRCTSRYSYPAPILLRRLTWYDIESLPDVTIQDYVDVVARLIDGDQALPDIIEQEYIEKFDAILGEHELTPEHYAVLCSAIFNSLYSVHESDIIEPPTARTILGDVFQRLDYNSKLKLIWGLTLNGYLVRAEPLMGGVAAPDSPADPLDDCYVIADRFLQFIDSYTESHQKLLRFTPIPVKNRAVCEAQIGYDAQQRKPVRVTTPDEYLTQAEWEELISELNTLELADVKQMYHKLEEIWQVYLTTQQIDNEVASHNVFKRACKNGTIIPFRVYLILHTLKYNFYYRSYPSWYFYRPDDEVSTSPSNN